jgi:hypothetical protein
MPELDRSSLENDLGLEPESIEPEIVELESDPFELEWKKENEDPEVLRQNIESANTILDRVKEEMENGNFSARMVEVAGNIINSITTASKVLMDDTNYNKYLDIRVSLVRLKKREVEIKELKGRRPPQQNLIVASREDVLRLINDRHNAEGDS